MINPDFIKIGQFSIKWYAVIIMTGALLAAFLSNREALRKKFPKDYIYDLLMYALPIGIIGARAYYVAFEFDRFKSDLLSVFKIWEGGLAIYGGLLAGIGVVYWYSKKFNVSSWVTLDIITPTVLLAQAIGRWGNFVNQEAFGAEVSREHLTQLFIPDFIINQMHINGKYYQPTFLYESVLSIIGFILLMVLRHKVKTLKIGDITLFYIIWYGIERFFVEGMRSDSLWLGSIRVSQALSLVLIMASVIIYVYRHKKQTIGNYSEFMYEKK
ncbi:MULTISPECIES: prolipoprotein diacylglyceryl transferase [unclassified Granulicatella]|uniref:prolipoprotein diacylglyceryl transferase n=1 Tax=unclassified Granulicatella TaxID=2630493 RepID=UPI00107393C2|nr:MULTISPECIES: prolipoprotein diacylglyceryl transferase [unclassified Granulicatella]MBF0779613.1 prolipoprotein diacylglyceryl transferase [Granulicatella sp. 19428wC4_WM01]TFU96412.1 prolipoprotein diacylglyceryl transferase [Granulicatella sp. WM01]